MESISALTVFKYVFAIAIGWALAPLIIISVIILFMILAALFFTWLGKF